MPYHLLFPLFSSVAFVLGVMLAKRGILRGCSPWTTTILGNLWLALAFGSLGLLQDRGLPVSAWWQAGLIGVCFAFGQMFTYFAFQVGDVSVAAPVFGIKVLIVATLMTLLTGDPVAPRVWVGAVLATLGVALVQLTGLRQGAGGLRRIAVTIALVVGAGISLSLFDIGLQRWGGQHGATVFLPIVFLSALLTSCLVLPRVNPPADIRRMGATRWILGGTLLMAMQAMSMAWALSNFGDAARINIVYALRSLWGVLLAWALARQLGGAEATLGRGLMLTRLLGAVLLTTAVMLAVTA